MSTTSKDRLLRAHFDRFIDRDARYPGYVLTDAAWTAFKKSESHGKRKMTPQELELAAPLFGAKWSYEITIQSLWQEMADCWSSGWGWDIPLRHTISCVWREGSNRVYLRALFKIRRSIIDNGFISSMNAYTGLAREDKARYLDRWEDNTRAMVARIRT